MKARNLLCVLTTISSCSLACGCFSNTTNSSVVSHNDARLLIDGPRKIQKTNTGVYTVTSNFANDNNYVWSISNTNVASISSTESNTCTVVGSNLGRTYLTVLLEGTTNSCTFEIEVIKPSPSSIQIIGQTELYVNEDSEPYKISYSPEECQTGVTWSITKGEALALIASGVVHPMKEGEITIKATSTSDTSVFNTFDIVIHPQKPTQLTISGPEVISSTLGPIQYSIEVQPKEASDEVTWSIPEQEQSCATIDENGLLTPLSEGVVNITAISKVDPNIQTSKSVQIIGKVYNLKFSTTVGKGFTWDAPSYVDPSKDLIICFHSTLYEDGYDISVPTHKELKPTDLEILLVKSDGKKQPITDFELVHNVLTIPKTSIKGDLLIRLLGAEISDFMTWKLLYGISNGDVSSHSEKCKEFFQVGDYKKIRLQDEIHEDGDRIIRTPYFAYCKIIDFFHDKHFDPSTGEYNMIPFTFMILDDKDTLGEGFSDLHDECFLWGEECLDLDSPGLYGMAHSYSIGDSDLMSYISPAAKVVQTNNKYELNILDLDPPVTLEKLCTIDNYLSFFPLDYKELNGNRNDWDYPDCLDKGGEGEFTAEELIASESWTSTAYAYFSTEKYICEKTVLQRRLWNVTHHPVGPPEVHYVKDLDLLYVRTPASGERIQVIDVETGQIMKQPIWMDGDYKDYGKPVNEPHCSFLPCFCL